MAIAFPLVLGRVPPNPWYGFRVPQTLNDPAVWYPANAYAGRLLVILGVLMMLVAVGLAAVPGFTVLRYTLLCTAILLVGLLGVVVLTLVYLRTLDR